MSRWDDAQKQPILDELLTRASEQTIRDVARKRRRTLEGLYKMVQRLRAMLFECVQKVIREEEEEYA